MSINVEYFSSLDTFVKNCTENNNKYFLLVSQKCKFYISLLRNSKIQAYGAFFPELIFEGEIYTDGLLAYKLDENDDIFIQKDISNITLTQSDFENVKSVITFVDALSPYKQTYLDNLFELLPVDTQIMGGGSGELPYNRKEVIFSNNGIYKDAAIILCKKQNLKVGIEHGWKILKDKLVATMSNKNILSQIDYQNALDVYKDIIKEDLKEDFTNVPFHLLKYPIGLVKYGNKIHIKEVINVDEKNGFTLGSCVSQNSIICVLKGTKDNLIKAAYNATKKAVEQCENNQSLVFLFDDIDRRIFLKDRYYDQLEIIKRTINNKTLIGALTLGEILNEDNINLTFYNKTCVVGALC
ncbi:hypothetical protein CRV00_02305 [Malaciobacter molluscorum]|uniref:FIST signal transduction protein n=1 Tax=Malaciobacter molluscorum TaxID=1032072 RepID=UPI00100A47ED|nr:FIST C-terminal domain-containing protein [Malaciobacter molluscorum]RXJ96470.1 hypothetical protein CRV00_02305 [Malaciobacter molluscorum]